MFLNHLNPISRINLPLVGDPNSKGMRASPKGVSLNPFFKIQLDDAHFPKLCNLGKRLVNTPSFPLKNFLLSPSFYLPQTH